MMRHFNIIKLLYNKGANLNKKDEDNKTPLHFAACSGNPEIVNFLIDNGADVKAIATFCNEKVSVIDIARKCKQDKIIEYLNSLK